MKPGIWGQGGGKEGRSLGEESEVSCREMLEIVRKHVTLFSGPQVFMMSHKWTAASPENRAKHLPAIPTLSVNMERE